MNSNITINLGTRPINNGREESVQNWIVERSLGTYISEAYLRKINSIQKGCNKIDGGLD